MIDSARDLFRVRGYSGTGFRDVVTHSGAPRGSIYHHFPRGKTQLAEEVIQHDVAAFTAHVESRRAADPIAVLRAYMAWGRATLKATECTGGCPVAALVVEAHDGSELIDAASAAWTAAVDGFAGALRAAGVSRERASSIATLVFASLQGAVLLARAARDVAPLDAAERELERLVRDAIGVARR